MEHWSQELFISNFKYQNSTKWWRHQRLELNLLKSSSFLAVIPKAPQTKFYQIRITNSKVIHVQIPAAKWKKTEKWEKNIQGTKRGNKRIKNQGRFLGFQIGAREITNRDSFRDFKSGQKDYKSRQRDFKLGQVLQIGAEQWLHASLKSYAYFQLSLSAA